MGKIVIILTTVFISISIFGSKVQKKEGVLLFQQSRDINGTLILTEGSSSKSSISNFDERKRYIKKPIDFNLKIQLTQIFDISIEVYNFEESYEKLSKLIEKYKPTIASTKQNQYRRTKRISITFWCNKKTFDILKKEIIKLGLVEHQNLRTQNVKDKNDILKMELQHLYEKAKDYDYELKKIDPHSDNYLQFWNTIQSLNDQVFRLEKQLKINQQTTHHYTINLNLAEHRSEPVDSFEFVNMPGFEYNYLRIENRKKGVSSQHYQGGAIRYMFSKGKSYLIFNIMKGIDSISDENEIEDIFTYAYGVDFYPRHLGAGRRVFLNPFSGFTIGGGYYTSKVDSFHTFQFSAHLGIEFVKTRYILWDLKVGYSLPISDKNKNFRGVLATSGINFMF